MSDTLTDEQRRWAKTFTGIDFAPAGAAAGGGAPGGAAPGGAGPGGKSSGEPAGTNGATGAFGNGAKAGVAGASKPPPKPARPGIHIVHSVQEMDDDLDAYESGRAPTPMALPDDKPKTRQERAADEKRRHEQESKQHEEEAHRKKLESRDDARIHSPELYTLLRDHIELKSLKYRVLTTEACDAFAQYADGKVSEFSSEFSAEDVFGDVLKDVVGMLAGKLGEQVGKALSDVGGKIADGIWKKVQGALTAKLQGEVAAQFSGMKKGADGLRAAIKAIQAGAKAARNDMDAATADLRDKLKKMGDQVNQTGELDAADIPFAKDLLGDPDNILVSFGVPSGSLADDLKTQVLHKLIKAFEKQLIMAKRVADDLDPGSLEPTTLDRAAERHAQEALKAIGEDEKKDKERAPT